MHQGQINSGMKGRDIAKKVPVSSVGGADERTHQHPIASGGKEDHKMGKRISLEPRSIARTERTDVAAEMGQSTANAAYQPPAPIATNGEFKRCRGIL